jgi:hypothetical protein
MNPRTFLAPFQGHRAAKSQTKGSIWNPGRQVNNQENRNEGKQAGNPAINVFFCVPAFPIHLLPASRRGSNGAEMNPRNFFAEPKRRNPRFQTLLTPSIAAGKSAAR